MNNFRYNTLDLNAFYRMTVIKRPFCFCYPQLLWLGNKAVKESLKFSKLTIDKRLSVHVYPCILNTFQMGIQENKDSMPKISFFLKLRTYPNLYTLYGNKMCYRYLIFEKWKKKWYLWLRRNEKSAVIFNSKLDLHWAHAQ